MATKTVIDNIVSVLIRLDREASKSDISAYEFAKRGNAIKHILNKIENDFGLKFMIDIFVLTNQKLGHTLGPLHTEIIQKLTSQDFTITNIKNAVFYKK